MDIPANGPRQLVVDSVWISTILLHIYRNHGTNVQVEIFVPTECYATLIAHRDLERRYTFCQGYGGERLHFYSHGGPVPIVHESTLDTIRINIKRK